MTRDRVDIRCPVCGQRAAFWEPFIFIDAQRFPSDERRPAHKWGDWMVIERFPTHLPWRAPNTAARHPWRRGEDRSCGYPMLTHGWVQCPHCHADTKHRLQWPEEAYWQWQIRGKILWAWDRPHAETILAFIAADHRPSRRAADLRRLPAHFLSAKVRDLTVKRMRQLLEETPDD